jgi:hypothetical protein
MTTGRGIYGSTTNSATANITGELFTLPGGAVGVAAGLEHRSQRGYGEPHELEQRGYTTALGAKTTRGDYSVREAYLEANVPLLKERLRPPGLADLQRRERRLRDAVERQDPGWREQRLEQEAAHRLPYVVVGLGGRSGPAAGTLHLRALQPVVLIGTTPARA